MYSAVRTPEFPETFVEFLHTLGTDFVDQNATALLTSLIDNESIGTTINGLAWSVITTFDAPHLLMTSDRPVWMPIGLGLPDAHILLPIGPHHLFVAARSREALEGIRTIPSRRLVREMNGIVVGQARRFVFASDISQARFVTARFGSLNYESLVMRFAGLRSQARAAGF
jgi:hypothetical protein